MTSRLYEVLEISGETWEICEALYEMRKLSSTLCSDFELLLNLYEV